MIDVGDAKALLFDCDGTLVDTHDLFRICWHQVLGRHGFEVTVEWYQIWSGHSVDPFLRAALPEADDELLARISEEGVQMFLESTHLLKPLEHVVDIARSCRGVLPMAVVSGGPGPAVRATLAAVGLTDWFQLVITADDVPTGKPAPDGYRLAMELLAVTPDECIAFEDSANGIAAAKNAGIPSIFDVRLLAP